MKNKKILIIIPAYNEEKNIKKTYDSILEYNKKNKTKYDVIVINDGSKDNTEQVLKENKIPHITLIKNLGIGGAVQTGYIYAERNNYDIAIQFDGDGQHDVNYVKNIIEPILTKNADLVIGSRFIEELSEFKSSTMRQIGIKLISFFIKLFTGKKIYDTTSGFRACNKRTIMEFSRNYPYEYPEPISTTKILKRKYKVFEVPVKMNERTDGVSSIKAWKTVYYMFNVIFSIIAIGLGGVKKWILN